MNATTFPRTATLVVIWACLMIGEAEAALEHRSAEPIFALSMPAPVDEELPHTPHREAPIEFRIAEAVVTSSATVSATPAYIKTVGRGAFRLR